MTLCTERIRTLDDIRAFLGGNEAADITPHDREAAYAFIERALVRFRYHLGLSRAGKGRVREFLAKVTGYSDSQLSRLIAQQRRTGRIRDHRLRPPARPFATVYTTADAVLLAEVDEAFGQPSGPAIKRILWRQYHVFGDERFERLAEISNGHIYNLRGRRAYRVPGPRFGRRYDRQAAQTPAGSTTWAARRGPTVTQFQPRPFPGSPRLHGPRARGARRRVPLPHPGVPRRQRVGVHQPPGRGDAESARRAAQTPGRESKNRPGVSYTGHRPQQRRLGRRESLPGAYAHAATDLEAAQEINMGPVDEVTQFQQLMRPFPGSPSTSWSPCSRRSPARSPSASWGSMATLTRRHDAGGSEYINHRVAAMLNKLHVEEFTKSRPRRSNDNALVESKNGNVVRRWLGHSHIPEHLAPPANAFLRDFLSPFLNHHRACLFAVEVEESNGRRRRKYPQELVMTPYEKLGSLPGADGFLKPGITFEQLDAVAHAATDLEAAQEIQRARKALFRLVAKALNPAA